VHANANQICIPHDQQNCLVQAKSTKVKAMLFYVGDILLKAIVLDASIMFLDHLLHIQRNILKTP